MKSDVRWQVRGVRRQARETAREAARRSGMSVGQWLDSVIIDTATDEGVAPQPHDTPLQHVAPPARRTAPSDFDPSYIERAEELRRMRGTLPAGPARWASDRTEDPRSPRPLHSVESRAYQPAPVLPAVDEGFAEVKDRLDDLKRQLESIARPQSAMPQPASHEDEAARQFAEVISKLDHKLDQLITDNKATKLEIEQRMHGVKRAVADFGTESHRTRLPAAPATPLDQALLEIADRQRTLDEPPPEASAAAVPPSPTASPSPAASPVPSDALPRAFTQEFSGLEQQLRQINSQIETLNRPCGIDKAVDTLRDDLAEIGVMLQDAMPRRAVEALESEMRKLAERIDQTRQTGADATALAGLERGLAEVRDALRIADAGRKPCRPRRDGEGTVAEGRPDRRQQPGSGGPQAARRRHRRHARHRHACGLERRAGQPDRRGARALRQGRPGHQSSGGSDMLATLERRIGTLADALEARNQQRPGSAARTRNRGRRVDRQDRAHPAHARRDQTALGHLEDRIAKLVEKLDASDQPPQPSRGDRTRPCRAADPSRAPAPSQRGPRRWWRTGARGRRAAARRHRSQADGAQDPGFARGGARRARERRQSARHDRDRHPRQDRPCGQHRPGFRAELRRCMARQWLPPRPSRRPLRSVRRSSLHRPSPPQSAHPNPTRSIPIPAAVARPVAETVPHPTPRACRRAVLPGAANRSSSLRSRHGRIRAPVTVQRRPIDPNLPPDHPLEPGVPRGAAARRPIASPRRKRRSARSSRRSFPILPASRTSSPPRAAPRRLPPAKRRRAPERARPTKQPGLARPSKFLAPLRKHARALIIGVSVLAIVLGSLNIVKNWLASHEEAPATVDVDAGRTERRSSRPPLRAPRPKLPSRQSSRPPDRQSSLTPAPSFPPPERNAGAARGHRLPSSQPRRFRPRPPRRPRQPFPLRRLRRHRPSMRGRARPPPSAVAANDSEKLPAGITGALRAAAAKGDPARAIRGRACASPTAAAYRRISAAAEWFERAAKQGSAPAQFRLGGLYEKGLGVKKNFEAAPPLLCAGGRSRQRQGAAQSGGALRRRHGRQARLPDRRPVVPQGRRLRHDRQPVQSRRPLRARHRRGAEPRRGLPLVRARRPRRRQGIGEEARRPGVRVSTRSR